MSLTIVGGLRARLIYDSFWHMLDDALSALGWYAMGTQHDPVALAPEPVDFNKDIPLNTVALAELTSRSEGAEMGSNLEDDTTTFYVDFFAEDDAMGKHLIGDVRDILRGKIHAIGRSAPMLVVRDWRQPDPKPVLFTCEFQDVVPDRAHNWPHPWQQHWFTCRVDLVDTYGSDEDLQFNDFDGLTMGDLF